VELFLAKNREDLSPIKSVTCSLRFSATIGFSLCHFGLPTERLTSRWELGMHILSGFLTADSRVEGKAWEKEILKPTKQQKAAQVKKNQRNVKT
jgi:hypothetical protein